MTYRKVINEIHYCTACVKALTEGEVATVTFITSDNLEEDNPNQYMVAYELCEECKNAFKRIIHSKTVGTVEGALI